MPYIDNIKADLESIRPNNYFLNEEEITTCDNELSSLEFKMSSLQSITLTSEFKHDKLMQDHVENLLFNANNMSKKLRLSISSSLSKLPYNMEERNIHKIFYKSWYLLFCNLLSIHFDFAENSIEQRKEIKQHYKSQSKKSSQEQKSDDTLIKSLRSQASEHEETIQIQSTELRMQALELKQKDEKIHNLLNQLTQLRRERNTLDDINRSMQYVKKPNTCTESCLSTMTLLQKETSSKEHEITNLRKEIEELKRQNQQLYQSISEYNNYDTRTNQSLIDATNISYIVNSNNNIGNNNL
ncbi:hypothetical protein AB837_00580 [bacterium AB1]|nr:hypothetical protein AB837_00580 [bacterium AB1]